MCRKYLFLLTIDFLSSCNFYVSPPDDKIKEEERLSCHFEAGDHPSKSLGNSLTKGPFPIDTIVVVMQENRSFDSYFGHLPSYGQPDVDVAGDVTLYDDMGVAHHSYHEHHFCEGDVVHTWDGYQLSWNKGANDGFSKVNFPNSDRPLGWEDSTDIKFYYDLANTYAISDRFFSSLMGPTEPNRDFFSLGTSLGKVTDIGQRPSPEHTTIYRELNKKGISFGVYSSWPNYSGNTDPCAGNWLSNESWFYCSDIPQGAQGMDAFLAQAKSGTLPHFVMLAMEHDEHPGTGQDADPQIGEVDVERVYRILTNSPQWGRIAFFLIYDESGGLYDHVPPPPACPPDDIEPILGYDGSNVPGRFDRYGFRIPFIAISAWAKPHYVSHKIASSTSILRFVETIFDLPALSRRDANEWNLMDIFDFSYPSYPFAPEIDPVLPVFPGAFNCPSDY